MDEEWENRSADFHFVPSVAYRVLQGNVGSLEFYGFHELEFPTSMARHPLYPMPR